MKHTIYKHYASMFVIMIVAGLLTTMNMWVDKYDIINVWMDVVINGFVR